MIPVRIDKTRWIVAIAVAWAGVFVSDTANARVVAQPENLGIGPPAVESTPERVPRPRLTPIPGFDDDAAYIHSIAERVREILSREGGVAPPFPEIPEDITDIDSIREQEKTQVLETIVQAHQPSLAAANQILAFLLEPVCSRKILGLPINPDEFAETRIGAELARVNSLLETVEDSFEHNIFKTLPPTESVRRAQENLRNLRAFYGALHAYLLAGQDEEGTREARRAASRLSPLMEQDDPRVVAAATLWQALLRSLEDDPDRALSVLDLALVDPQPESMPHAFFSRVLRCRLIGRRGGEAAALALLLQLEERCHDWLTDDGERAAAIRVIQWERIRLMTHWREQPPTAKATPERRWCHSRAAVLMKEVFVDRGDTLFRLTPAIPILVGPAKIRAQDPARPHEGT